MKARFLTLSPSLSLALVAAAVTAASAECPRWEKLNESGNEAIQMNDFKRGESTWLKAVKESENCPDADGAVPVSLKRLGECYLKNAKYQECAATLKQAQEKYKASGTEDKEVVADLASLALVYRSVEVSEISQPTAQKLFQQAGVNAIGIYQLDEGSRIQVNLADKFLKDIDQPPVEQVQVDRTVSFDMYQDADGSVRVCNIKGLKVKAKFWVNLVQSLIKPATDGTEPTAEVTAEKMGISKTVSCKLPIDVLEPLNAFIAKLRDFSNGKGWNPIFMQPAAAATTNTATAVPTTPTSQSAATAGMVPTSAVAPASAIVTISTPSPADSTPGSHKTTSATPFQSSTIQTPTATSTSSPSAPVPASETAPSASPSASSNTPTSPQLKSPPATPPTSSSKPSGSATGAD